MKNLYISWVKANHAFFFFPPRIKLKNLCLPDSYCAAEPYPWPRPFMLNYNISQWRWLMFIILQPEVRICILQVLIDNRKIKWYKIKTSLILTLIYQISIKLNSAANSLTCSPKLSISSKKTDKAIRSIHQWYKLSKGPVMHVPLMVQTAWQWDMWITAHWECIKRCNTKHT